MPAAVVDLNNVIIYHNVMVCADDIWHACIVCCSVASMNALYF